MKVDSRQEKRFLKSRGIHSCNPILKKRILSAQELLTLDGHLSEYSYVGGYLPTQADFVLLKSGHIPSDPPHSLPSVRRWAAHMASFSASELEALPQLKDGCKV